MTVIVFVINCSNQLFYLEKKAGCCSISISCDFIQGPYAPFPESSAPGVM